MEQQDKALIVDWNQDGRGVARVNGKVVFIEDALPGEVVLWESVRVKKSYFEGKINYLLRKSPARVQPRCDYYAVCGGCSCQHVEFTAQVALKQRAWRNQMLRLGKVQPEELLAPIYGWAWRYRERVRLSTCYVQGHLLLGFRGKGSHDVVDVEDCLVLSKAVSQALKPIKAVLRSWPVGCVRGVSINQGDSVIALTLQVGDMNRHMRMQMYELIELLQEQTGWLWQWWLDDGRSTVLQMPSAASVLAFCLPEYQVEILYEPQDFTQVNQSTNALMVRRAMQWLQPRSGERIIDWFCGLGNFSLPIARTGAQVTGVEGVEAMCQRARNNALYNHLEDFVCFQQEDLFSMDGKRIRQFAYAHKWLLDPPRAGAQALVMALGALKDELLPRRIVYVSCDPSTLARDAGLLVRRGYRYRAGGIMNLFAQTMHVESLAVFDWPEV